MGRCLPRRICGGKVLNQQWHLHQSTGYQDSLAFYEMNQNDIFKNVQSLGNISPPIHDERKKAAINLRIILFGTLHL